VLSIDEKSRTQAVDRTQTGLPLKKGRYGTMTHDYIRNGITTIFAALNLLDGRVIGCCMQQHRHQEFIRFRNTVEAAVPAAKLIRAIADNCAISASRFNAVEGYFAELTRRRLKRGVFRSIVDLKAKLSRHQKRAPSVSSWPLGSEKRFMLNISVW
jgi:hypothetical protein